MTIWQAFVLGVNVVWFGLAFRLFGLRPRQAVNLLTPESARGETSREALVVALPFLGGMNLGFSALSALQLGVPLLGGAGAAPWTVFLASSIAHASQFLGNVPLALRGGRAGGAAWDVLRGPMAFIFVVDALAAVLNAVATVVG